MLLFIININRYFHPILRSPAPKDYDTSWRCPITDSQYALVPMIRSHAKLYVRTSCNWGRANPLKCNNISLCHLPFDILIHYKMNDESAQQTTPPTNEK